MNEEINMHGKFRQGLIRFLSAAQVRKRLEQNRPFRVFPGMKKMPRHTQGPTHGNAGKRRNGTDFTTNGNAQKSKS